MVGALSSAVNSKIELGGLDRWALLGHSLPPVVRRPNVVGQVFISTCLITRQVENLPHACGLLGSQE
jgi:hypothetical protein